MESVVYIPNNYLQHHGILGQKWGVRNYQNEDGTLTEEGKIRYGYSLTSIYENETDNDYTLKKGTYLNRRTQSDSEDGFGKKRYTYTYDYDSNDDSFYKQFGQKVSEYEIDDSIFAGKSTLGKAFVEKMFTLTDEEDIDAMDTLYYDARSRLGKDYVEDLFALPFNPNKNPEAMEKAGALMISKMLAAQRNDAKDEKMKKRGTRHTETAANDIGLSIMDNLMSKGYSGMRDYNDYGSSANVNTPSIYFDPDKKLRIKRTWIDNATHSMIGVEQHNMIYFSNDYLQHHGIQGQKWGVRRYQNEDGTLTEEGRKRYGTSENYEYKMERRKTIAKASGTAAKIGAAVGAGLGAVTGIYASAMMSAPLAAAAVAVAVTAGTNAVNWAIPSAFWTFVVNEIKLPANYSDVVDKIIREEEAIKKEREKLQSIEHSDLYLEHHGILGQKWGVRRYQNEDGTLTPLGAQKRNSIRDYTDEELRREIDRTRLEKEYNREMGYGSKYYKGKTKKKPFSKKVDVSAMDDDELEAYVNRRYLEMKAEDADRAEVEKGINYINNLMRTAGNVVSTASSIASLVNTISNTKASIDNNKFAKEQRELEKKRMAKYYNDASRLDEQELLARTRTEQNRWAYVNARSGKSGQSSKNDQSKSKPKNKQQGRRLKVTGMRFS